MWQAIDDMIYVEPVPGGFVLLDVGSGGAAMCYVPCADAERDKWIAEHKADYDKLHPET